MKIVGTYLNPAQVKEFYINAAKVQTKGKGQKANDFNGKHGNGRSNTKTSSGFVHGVRKCGN